MAEISAESGGSGSGGKTTPSETVRPGQSDTADEQSPSRPATPSRSTRLKRRMLSPIKDIFRRQASPANQSAPSREEAPDKGPEDASIPAPETLISPGIDINFEEGAISDARKIDMCDKAILAINIFEKAVELTEIVLPSGISDTLETLVRVLEVLKQMIENREAWKDLLLTLDDHRKQFNGQIIRLKQESVKPDPNSPLLEPLGRYSEALRGLTANVINDSGLMQGNTPATPAWSKIKKFITQYMEAESEKEKIQDYHDELLAAMRDLMQSLVIYTAFETHDTNVAVGRMEPEMHDMKVQMDLIAERISAPLVPKRRVKAKAPPHVTPFYVKREVEWNLMMDHLIKSEIPGLKILPITGMGGCGKTQMVAYFLQQNRAMFPNVIYVDASSEATIKADLQTWAQSLAGDHEQDEWEDGLRLLADGSLDGRCAYVLDNADDPKLPLQNFLPDSDATTVTVIITSRNGIIGNLATTCQLEIGEMTEAEGFATLLKAAKRTLPIPSEERKSADALIKEMGGLALALVQAGAYCRSISSGYSFTQYLLLFRSKRAILMKKDQLFPRDKYKLGVYTTLDLSYEAMSTSVREFFHLTSYFRYSDISVAMSVAAARNHFGDPKVLLSRQEGHAAYISRLCDLFGNDHDLDQVQPEEFIQNLNAYSLVSTTGIGGSLFIRYHPLVQAWARDMRSSDATDYRNMAMQVITSCCTDINISIYRYLIPHITIIMEEEDCSRMHVNDKAAFGVVMLDAGYHDNAKILFEGSLETLRQFSGIETKETLWVATQLAEVYGRQGRYEKSEILEREVLETQRRIWGADHQYTIQASSDLAGTYHNQGRLAEAEMLELEVLEKRTKILGVDHLETIQAANNLAGTYHDQGRLAKAETLLLEVMEKRKKILGPDHLETIQAANSLATTYHSRGRLAEAETLKLEVLEKRTKILGADHIQTIRVASNLAVTYYAQSRLSEAEALQLEILEKQTKIQGADHLETIETASTLAVTYHSQGRLVEAETLDSEVLEKRTKILGANHLETIEAASNLARTYYSQNRLSEAEKLQLEVLEKRTKILGADHLETIRAASNLVRTYYSQNRLSEAEKLQLEVLEKRTKILGADHLETIRAASTLAATYYSQNRLSEAATLDLEVLEKRMKILGGDHPDTLKAARNLADTHRAQGRLHEPVRLDVDEPEQEIVS